MSHNTSRVKTTWLPGAGRFRAILENARPILRASLTSRALQIGPSLFSRRPWQAQRAVHTALDRYPEAFAAAVHFARTMRPGGDTRPLRVLSFGCSTGEECFSLRAYFPNDTIYGCDINDSVLAVAMQRQKLGGIVFFHSSSRTLREHGPFDIVFCMSSLCLFPEANRPSGENGTFSLSAFDDLLSEIDCNLRPGGLLVIYNASYSFRFSSIASEYDVVRADVLVENGFVNKLHRSGRAFTVTDTMNHSRCHRMVSDPEAYRDRDLTDCMFQKRAGGPRYEPSLDLSPTVAPGSQVLCNYTLRDEDLFGASPTLLTATYSVELVRDRSGTLFERVEYCRKSMAKGNAPVTGRYVRIAITTA
jgi:SAM-dependent methyltransferase